MYISIKRVTNLRVVDYRSHCHSCQ